MAHTRRRILAVAGAALMSATLMSGCSDGGDSGGSEASGGSSTSSDGGDSGSKEEVRIGAMYLDSQGYYGGVKAGVKEAADASGTKVKLVESTSAGDVAKESSFMSSLIASQVDAIIMSAVSADGSVAAVKQAHEAGIPVICYNTCVSADAMEKYVTAYILGDPVKFGEMIGQYAGEYLKEAGQSAPQFGVLNCEQYEVCQERMKGFTDAVTKVLPEAKIAANLEGTEADKAISVGEQMLTSNPDITATWGQSGGATVGGFKAVENRSKTGSIVAFGSDMTTDIAMALKDGSVLKGVVDISGKAVGKLAYEAADKAIKGESFAEKVIPAPIELYQPEDAQKWMDTHQDGLP